MFMQIKTRSVAEIEYTPTVQEGREVIMDFHSCGQVVLAQVDQPDPD